MNKLYNRSKYLDLRREFRNQPTPAENKLWYYLKGKGLGAKFRRQHGIGRYVADFCSPRLKLIIEVDGDSHFTDEGIQHDTERQKFLESLGFTILRFTNLEVLKNITAVIDVISEKVKTIAKPPLTPP